MFSTPGTVQVGLFNNLTSWPHILPFQTKPRGWRGDFLILQTSSLLLVPMPRVQRSPSLTKGNSSGTCTFGQLRVKTQVPQWGWVTEVWSWPLLFLLLYSSEMWGYRRLYAPGRKGKWGTGILEQEDTGNQLKDLPLLPSAVCMAIGIRAIGGKAAILKEVGIHG